MIFLFFYQLTFVINYTYVYIQINPYWFVSTSLPIFSVQESPISFSY